MTLVLGLEDLSKEDTGKVGGKSANLGELARMDIPVLPGFTTTSDAYDLYVSDTGIEEEIRKILEGLDVDDTEALQEAGEKIREIIIDAEMPGELREKIIRQYSEMADELGEEEPAVAVRSSATAEDLPTASFAGQQETYLNVEGEEELLESVKKCYASLFTDRAISYREDKGFDHFDVKLSAIVQKMGHSDNGSAGVMFTIDPDSGFEDVVVIESSYGLGEVVVQGEVNPDEFVVFKPTNGIVEKVMGDKEERMVDREGENVLEEVPAGERNSYSLTEEQVKELASYAETIEEHYDKPMDVEWLLDGDLEELFIVQARPETVRSAEKENVIEEYRLKEEGEVLARGVAIGDRIGAGKAKLLESPEEMERFEEGEVLVTEMTDPDWEPIMKQAGAIVTEKGGKTSHAAIVSRELGVPAVVGASGAREVLGGSQEVTVDCTGSSGEVMDGEVEFEVEERELEEIPETDTDVMLILGDPYHAFSHASLPVDGVGLAREEFVIASNVGEHPLHLIEKGEEDKFVKALKEGLGRIAAAFYPEPVIVRFSDFKTDEYRGLEGGEEYEAEESNPMLGWRGASRYYDEDFREAFALECEAIKQVRRDVGLDNVKVMVPFCRTPEEGERVLELIEENGLDTEEMDVYVMAEVPSNIVLADRFGELFDGFSIGSNDLTQLTLGVDRNSKNLAYLFDESNEAVKRSIHDLIDGAEDTGCEVGICGDAPSTIEGYAEFLVEEDIDSISVTPDVALETIEKVAEAESRD
ncbi:MAG: phosphoenolpyruvate synthase [Candidatus Nanohaloarchaeota archaeon QJJ-7]|nr:phosphoenolpyruvate synthase [Candidatus Nanohaloarchaeota archaeon QJJ-7]